MKKASLLVVQGVEQGTRFELGDRQLAVGRDARSDIRIHDDEVSRNHATLQKVKDDFVLTDRNSSNGTLVNGVAIRSHVLAAGDQIQLGSTLLLFSGASRERWQESAADRVQLLRRHDPADRSSIVTHLGQETAGTPAPIATEGGDSPNSLSVLYRIAEEVARPSSSLEQSLQRTLDLTMSAVLNIVTNAIDAVEGADRATVTIETGLHPTTEMFWVSVSDNGPGIVDDQLQRIFNVFESTKGARGTGLGLAVSQ